MDNIIYVLLFLIGLCSTSIITAHFVSINHSCYLSYRCNHTQIIECGNDEHIHNTRLFLDECDMLEHNCENKKEYKIVAKEKCSSHNTEENKVKESQSDTLLDVTTSQTHCSKTSIHTETSTAPFTIESPTTLDSTLLTMITTVSPDTTTQATSTISSLLTTAETLSPNQSTIETSTEMSPPLITSSPTQNSLPTTITLSSIPETTINNDSSTEVSLPITANNTQSADTTFVTSQYNCTRKENKTTSLPTTTSETSPTPVTNVTTSETQLTTTTGSTLSSESTPNITTLETNITPQDTTLISSTLNTSTIETTEQTVTETSMLGTTLITESITDKINATTSVTIHHNVTELIPNNCTYTTYPKDCNRPVTWETTSEGENKDFYQIMKSKYGRRARLLKDTTHWAKRIKYYAKNLGNFVVGSHNERYI